MAGPLQHVVSAFTPDVTVSLQIRLFRLFCATTCVLCLVVVLPINLFQNLPVGVNIADVLLGIAGGWCYWSSLRGRHFFMGFFMGVLLTLNPVWFLNGGVSGSIVYYFFALLLYPLAVFHGRVRWIMAVALVVDVSLLIVLEYLFPALTVPFQTRSDRLIDLISGVFCSSLALAVVARMIMENYERERRRISRYAEELATSERNYREIFNATSDALAIRDDHGVLIDVNDRMCLLYGWKREEMFGLSINDISLGESPYAQADAMEKVRRTFAEGPQVFVWQSRRRNGEIFWTEVALRAGEIAGQKRLITSIRDISPRLQAQEELRTQEQRLRLALEASHQGWFDIDVQTGEGRASAEYAKIIGLEPVDFKASAREWMEGVHPDDRAMAQQVFQECIATGQSRTFEYRRKARSGEWKWIRSIGKIVETDAQGRARRMLGTHTDITERKEMEARLVHTQRLESVATLAGGVAHDLNNILTPILMSVEVFGDKLTEPKDREMMAGLEKGARRGAAIVRQLLVFSRSVVQSRVAIDPGTLIRDAAQWVRTNFSPDIRVIEQAPAEMWTVTADLAQMRNVLDLLCTNAREAMPEGGTLTLAVENTRLTNRISTANPWGKSGAFVVISVTDTGRGIAPEIVGRIFDPFYTTKEVGKGSGLGLSAVHGIVTGHGGNVTVESTLGLGATFRVFLPANVPVTTS
jgi:PAS domain S-box-containing protein